MTRHIDPKAERLQSETQWLRSYRPEGVRPLCTYLQFRGRLCRRLLAGRPTTEHAHAVIPSFEIQAECSVQ